MQEPEYIYVKGQGWVIQTHPSITFNRGDKTIRLTVRTPVDGEYFHNFHENSPERAMEAIKRHLLNSPRDCGVVWDKNWAMDYSNSATNVVIEIL